jgi:hypothetical protein
VYNRTGIADSLQALYQCGKGMDELSLFPVPVDLLELLESETSNPELYRIRAYEEIEARSTEVAKRLHYLQVH